MRNDAITKVVCLGSTRIVFSYNNTTSFAQAKWLAGRVEVVVDDVVRPSV